MQKHKSLVPYVGATWLWPLDKSLTLFKETIAPVLKRRNEELIPAGQKVTPDQEVVFRAFSECPFDQIRVVIVGQDPYHTPERATGLCFDVPKGVSAPSLTNILKEIRKDYGKTKADTNEHSHLEHLPSQGVLLLNSALTTEEGVAGSHLDLWKPFLEQAVLGLNKKPHLVWVLWGKNAQKLRRLINPNHDVVEGAHPSPFSYHDTFYDKEKTKLKTKGFENSQFFLKINSLIKGSPIIW